MDRWRADGGRDERSSWMHGHTRESRCAVYCSRAGSNRNIGDSPMHVRRGYFRVDRAGRTPGVRARVSEKRVERGEHRILSEPETPTRPLAIRVAFGHSALGLSRQNHSRSARNFCQPSERNNEPSVGWHRSPRALHNDPCAAHTCRSRVRDRGGSSCVHHALVVARRRLDRPRRAPPVGRRDHSPQTATTPRPEPGIALPLSPQSHSS
jgi:hypothetical protein